MEQRFVLRFYERVYCVWAPAYTYIGLYNLPARCFQGRDVQKPIPL